MITVEPRDKSAEAIAKKYKGAACSRCLQPFGEGDIPTEQTRNNVLYRYCNRCVYDPDSDRCRKCGCTDNYACEMPCGWAEPGLCTNCVSDGQQAQQD